MNINERKTAFQRWLSNNEYTEVTINAYCRKITDLSKSFSGAELRRHRIPFNLFTILRIRRMDSVVVKIHALPTYTAVCRYDRRTLSSALNCYAEFLAEFSPERISDLVKGPVFRLLEQLPAGSREIENLQSLEYCRHILEQDYAVLVQDGRRFCRDRYYVTAVTIAGCRYYVTNDWRERQREALCQWMSYCESIIENANRNGCAV